MGKKKKVTYPPHTCAAAAVAWVGFSLLLLPPSHKVESFAAISSFYPLSQRLLSCIGTAAAETDSLTSLSLLLNTAKPFDNNLSLFPSSSLLPPPPSLVVVVVVTVVSLFIAIKGGRRKVQL